jgi:hypothetical protein
MDAPLKSQRNSKEPPWIPIEITQEPNRIPQQSHRNILEIKKKYQKSFKKSHRNITENPIEIHKTTVEIP